ncbi:unnamed protein product, partial [Amoebophrya sp. A25]
DSFSSTLHGQQLGTQVALQFTQFSQQLRQTQKALHEFFMSGFLRDPIDDLAKDKAKNEKKDEDLKKAPRPVEHEYRKIAGVMFGGELTLSAKNVRPELFFPPSAAPAAATSPSAPAQLNWQGLVTTSRQMILVTNTEANRFAELIRVSQKGKATVEECIDAHEAYNPDSMTTRRNVWVIDQSQVIAGTHCWRNSFRIFRPYMTTLDSGDQATTGGGDGTTGTALGGFASEVGAEALLLRTPDSPASPYEVAMAERVLFGYRLHASDGAETWVRGERQFMPSSDLLALVNDQRRADLLSEMVFLKRGATFFTEDMFQNLDVTSETDYKLVVIQPRPSGEEGKEPEPLKPWNEDAEKTKEHLKDTYGIIA